MQPFVVRLIELKPGVSHHQWQCDGSFFERFGNSEVLGADIRVEAELHYRGSTAEVQCELRGKLILACDRCSEELEVPVETSFEETYVLQGTELDLSQDVYDFVCISLPLKRVHEEGQCNQETIKYLSE